MSELLNFILDHEEPFKSKSRLTSLYSDFALLKTTNLDGYRANTAAWTSALTNASRAGLMPGQGRFTVRVDEELLRELETRNMGRPIALDAVVEDALASKTMMPMKDYLESKTNIFGKKWIDIRLPTPWQVAKWGLQQIGIRGSTLSRGDLVILANVEAASQAVLSKLTSLPSTPTARIWSLETFTREFDHVLSAERPLTSSDIQILLTYLTRDKNVAAMQTSPESDLVTIKFGSASAKATTPAITAQDSTIANLQTLSMRLNDQIALLNDSISATEATARTAISTSPPQKSRALSALRAKKMASATLEKRQASLEQVTQVLFSIDDAATQVDMVRAMEASTGVLRDLNKQVGGVDKVEEVMEGLREQMADVEDVSKVLGEIGVEGGSVDEAALDEEMEAILREDREKEEAERVKEQDNQKAALLESAPKPPEKDLPEPANKKTETRLPVSGVEDGLDERLRLLSLSGSG